MVDRASVNARFIALPSRASCLEGARRILEVATVLGGTSHSERECFELEGQVQQEKREGVGEIRVGMWQSVGGNAPLDAKLPPEVELAADSLDSLRCAGNTHSLLDANTTTLGTRLNTGADAVERPDISRRLDSCPCR